MDWLLKIQALDKSEIEIKRQTATQNTLDLWRWFTLEADKVYRSSPKAADAWNLHRAHRQAAQEHCKAEDISTARAELDKALTALQGAALTQHELF